jgi:hypothetical protein
MSSKELTDIAKDISFYLLAVVFEIYYRKRGEPLRKGERRERRGEKEQTLFCEFWVSLVCGKENGRGEKSEIN